jgi:hypothetical protein
MTNKPTHLSYLVCTYSALFLSAYMKRVLRVSTYVRQTKHSTPRTCLPFVIPKSQLHTSHTSYLPQHKSDHPPLPFRQPVSTMSDEDYEAFLNKANQDVSGATTQSKKSVGIKSVDTEVPQDLEAIDEVFVSDADEPFKPVSLKYTGSSLPSTGKFPLE